MMSGKKRKNRLFSGSFWKPRRIRDGVLRLGTEEPQSTLAVIEAFLIMAQGISRFDTIPPISEVFQTAIPILGCG